MLSWMFVDVELGKIADVARSVVGKRPLRRRVLEVGAMD